MAIELKPDRFANPLVTDPAIHADLKPLFHAVVMVAVWSQEIARCYPDLLALRESRGLPKPEEWPDSPALERNRAQHAAWVKAARDAHAERGESVMIGDFLEPRWTGLMREWSGYYRDWCDAIAKAKDAAKLPAVSAIMDAGEARPAHRWTTQSIIDLDNLAGTLHPINVGGFDGLGFVRCGLPPLPMEFPARAEAVGKRIAELRSIPVSAVPPPPNAPPIDPALLARLEAAIGANRTMDAGGGGYLPRDGEAGALRGEALAVALLVQHPDWTDDRIAKKAGVARTSLYRWDKFTAARRAQRDGAAPPRGTKDRESGRMEAWDR